MTLEQELLVSAQMLHHIIETHPTISGYQCYMAHVKLDQLIRNGNLLNTYPEDVLREEPDQELIKEYFSY